MNAKIASIRIKINRLLRKVKCEKHFPETSCIVGKVSTGRDTCIEASVGELPLLSSLNPLSVRLEDYVLAKPLGEGAYGSVFLAEHVGERRRVAMKVVKKRNLVNKRSAVNDLINEKDVLQVLSNGMGSSPKFFTYLHESFQDSYNFYFILEFVPGGSLFAELERCGWAFSEHRTRFNMSQLVYGVAYMHSQGIIHRDLKPENVLIDASGLLVITDFGLAKFVEDGLPFSYCGTVGYIAPEVHFKEPYSFEVDAWSLGCMMHEMLTGTLPFDSESPREIMHMTMVQPLDLPVDMEDATKDLLRSFLAKTPGTRKKVANAMSHPYFQSVQWAEFKDRSLKAEPHWIPTVDYATVEKPLPIDALLDEDVALDDHPVLDIDFTTPMSKMPYPVHSTLLAAPTAEVVRANFALATGNFNERLGQSLAARGGLAPLLAEPSFDSDRAHSWKSLFGGPSTFFQDFNLEESLAAGQPSALTTDIVLPGPSTVEFSLPLISPALSGATMYPSSSRASHAVTLVEATVPTKAALVVIPAPRGVRRMRGFYEYREVPLRP